MERETKVVGVGVAAEEHQISPPITVNWSTLVQGLGITFSGVAKMLTSLEPHMTQTIFEMVEAERNRLANTKNQSANNTETQGNQDGQDTTVNGMEPVMSDAPAPAADNSISEQKTPCTSSVTLDDITRVIVRKIKQDRKNNELIGSILKSYGVSKVSELTNDQYEAFMTDLAQL